MSSFSDISKLASSAGFDPSKIAADLKGAAEKAAKDAAEKATSAAGNAAENAAKGAKQNIPGASMVSSLGLNPSEIAAGPGADNASSLSSSEPDPLSPDAPPNTKGSDKRQEAANDVMCSEFQSLFIKNQTRYQEFIMRSLESYFQQKHTKVILDKMLTRNMSEYIKSNQFSGIVKSEIEKSIGSVMQTSLRSGLRSRKNYQKMCNDINKMVAARGGGGAKRKSKKKTIKRRN